jgi:hypothetical protein
MKKKFLFLISSLFFCITAHAGSFSQCTVGTIVTAGDQNVHVYLQCPAAFVDNPACATAGNWIGFDGSSPAGKRYLALVSLALAVGLKLDGSIDAACSPYQSNVAQLSSLRGYK